MRLSTRLAVFGLFALFASATVLGPAGAAMATAGMALGDRAAPTDGGCPGCPGDPEGSKAPCDEVCLAPFAAILAAGGLAVPAAAAATVAAAEEAEHGRTGPPEPGPPRPVTRR